jgi:hypothetical protein
MNFDGMDRETTRAVVQAQLDDLDFLASGMKRKRRQSDDTDQGIAIKSYRTELLSVARSAGIPETSFATRSRSTTTANLLATERARGASYRPTKRNERSSQQSSTSYDPETSDTDPETSDDDDEVESFVRTPSYQGSDAGVTNAEELVATNTEDERTDIVSSEHLEEVSYGEGYQSNSTDEGDKNSVDDEYQAAFTDNEDNAGLAYEDESLADQVNKSMLSFEHHKSRSANKKVTRFTKEGKSVKDKVQRFVFTAPSSITTTDEATTGECLVCTEQFHSALLVTLPCSHQYCKGCLVRFVTAAFESEELFPPRCCQQPLLLSNIQRHLSIGQISKFRGKEREFATPNRTYCHVESCSAFIPPYRINGQVGKCRKCWRHTCTTCKEKSHGRLSCPKDDALQMVLQLGQRNGWVRCYRCRTMVERLHGCNHMSKSKYLFPPILPLPHFFVLTSDCRSVCVCRAAFCYSCGRQWKTCKCDEI